MGAELDAEEQFGPYLVYERLGVGGMATVHRALERGIEGFERIVALKRLLPHLAEDASFIKSFVREAKLASFLNHVNIVQIFELGRVGIEYFISMEYIDGKDIRQILRHARKVTGPPPINVTVGMLIQLCEALEYAHTKHDEHGQPMLLVHRDVSPSNVIVTTRGHVKVIDFGIAKAQSSQLRTQTGRVKGKLAYMAPEAITGRELDARSDLFALGVIAHELLTARPLFASKNEYQTLLKVQRGDIMPPSTFNQSCPPELDAIVLRALARDPDERFSSANEMRDELLTMRKHYDLQTSYRDISMWVDYAFSMELPTRESASAAIHKTPTPKPRREDDDAVEIAWGGGEEISEVGPILLDDVPDVSQKHLSSAMQIANAIGDEIDDDIPAPLPTHGSPDSNPPSQGGERRERRGTNPGHTPAPPSNRASKRMMTQTTDPDGHRLLDDISVEIDDPEATLAAPLAADTQPSIPLTPPAVAVPVVRFKESIPPPMGQPIKSVATKPGYSPARAKTSTPVDTTDDDDAASTLTRESRPKMRKPQVGSALVARRSKGPNKTWVIVAALFACGAVATAVTLFVTRGEDKVVSTPEPPAPAVKPVRPRTVGMVKFDLEPPDAEVWIEGKLVHSGSPWNTELDAGAYQVQIQRTGYSAWLTTLELSTSETQLLRVVLEPLASEVNLAEATLKVTSTPAGLEAVLDGVVLPVKTPIKMPIKVGAHSIVLRDNNGLDVWKQDLVAQATVEYEYTPSMEPAKQRERDLRRRDTAPPPKQKPTPAESSENRRPAVPAPGPVAPTGTVAPTAPNETKTGSASPPTTALPPAAQPQVASAPAITTSPPAATKPAAVVPSPRPPTTPPVASPPPPAQPTSGRTVTVPPSAVTRTSGAAPEISQHKGADIPAAVASKVCISTAGRVSSVEVITKLDSRVAADIIRALQVWTYQPYLLDGTATAACFVVSFKLK